MNVLDFASRSVRFERTDETEVHGLVTEHEAERAACSTASLKKLPPNSTTLNLPCYLLVSLWVGNLSWVVASYVVAVFWMTKKKEPKVSGL